VLLAGLYLLLQRLMADAMFRGRLFGLAALMVVFTAAWFLISAFAQWADWWAQVGRITAPPLRPGVDGLTWGNPSAVMTMTVLLTIAAAAWLGFASRGRAVTCWLLVILTALVTLVSGSRGGWIGLFLGMAFTGVAWLSFAQNRTLLSRRFRSRATRTGLAAAMVVGIAGAILIGPGVLARASSGGEVLRLTFYESAIAMFREAPVQGTGPGTWVAQRIAYTPASEPDTYIPHAHNIVLQTLAEFGMLGVIGALVAALYVGRLLLNAIRGPDATRRRMGWAAVLGLAYFGGHQLLDFYADFPPGLFAVALPVAFLDATAPAEDRFLWPSIRRSEMTSRFSVIVGVGVAAVLALSFGGLAVSEGFAAAHDRAVTTANAGNWQGALDDARAAAAGDPDIPAYQVTLGLVAAHLGLQDEAAAAFAKGAAKDDLPASWLGLATAQVELGNDEGARMSLVRALRLGRQQPAIDVAAVGLYERMGDADEAGRALEEALKTAPTLAADDYWRSDPVIGPMLTSLVDEALSGMPVDEPAVELAIMTGRSDQADSMTAMLPPTSRELMELFARAWNGDGRAIDDMTAQLEREPLNLDLLMRTVRVLRHAGRDEEADRFNKWAYVFLGRSVVIHSGVRVARPGEAPSAGTGVKHNFYGHYTYRRPTPWDLIPPGVIHIIPDR
jgi:O-antigen ligase/tetratricopeptide (TPR) repeat protein